MSSIGTNNEGVLNYLGKVSAISGNGGSSSARGGGSANSWYEALSRAMGSTLDNQATKLTELSNSIGSGDDNPSTIALMSASAMRFQFLSTSTATMQNSIGEAHNSLARKS